MFKILKFFLHLFFIIVFLNLQSFSTQSQEHLNSCKDQTIAKTIYEKNGVELSFIFSIKDSNFSIQIKQPFNPLIYWTYPSKNHQEFIQAYPIFSGFDDLTEIINFMIGIIEKKEYQIQIDSKGVNFTLNLKVFKKIIHFYLPTNEIKDLEGIVFEMSQLFIKHVSSSSTPSFYEESEILYQKEFDLIHDWIDPKKSIRLTLLYNGKTDGFSSDDFHKKCDDKGPTLTLVESHLKKRFGGFTYIPWNRKSRWGQDGNAFLFSLTHQLKFKEKNGNPYSVYSDSHSGPAFGEGYDLYLSDHCAANFNSKTNLGSSYEAFGTEKISSQTVLAGDINFFVTALEVYLIEF